MRLRVRRDHVPYDAWVAEGCLETTEGNNFLEIRLML